MTEDAFIALVVDYWIKGFDQGFRDGYDDGLNWDEDDNGPDNHPALDYELNRAATEERVREEFVQERGLNWIEHAINTP